MTERTVESIGTELTVEYKDAIHHASVMFYQGIISNITLSRIAGDIADFMKFDSKITVLDDMEVLMDAWDKHPILTPTG